MLKINRKAAKKLSFYITFCACAASLWMLIVRFDYPAETFVLYALISIVFLFVLIAFAGGLAFLIRYFSAAKAASNDSDLFANLTSNKSIPSLIDELKSEEVKHEHE